MKCSVDSLCICGKYKIRRANARRIFHIHKGEGESVNFFVVEKLPPQPIAYIQSLGQQRQGNLPLRAGAVVADDGVVPGNVNDGAGIAHRVSSL